MCEEAYLHIAQRASRRRRSSQSGEAVGKCDHMYRFGTTAGRVLIELVLATLAQRDRQCISESYRITQAKVHALPACRAVRMCGVAGEHHPPGPVLVGHPLVDSKPGAPDHFSHLRRDATRTPSVQQLLSKGDIRLLGRIVDF